MTTRISFTIAAFACLSVTVGCQGRPDAIKFVVPVGYTGLIRVVLDESAEQARRVDGAIVLQIPESGIQRISGPDPFSEFRQYIAQETTGKAIPNEGQIHAEEGEPDPQRRLFRSVGFTLDEKEFWAVIGTEGDEQRARAELIEHKIRQSRAQ